MIKRSEKHDLHQLFTVGPLHQPSEVAGFAIWRLSLAYQRRVETALRDIGLTHTQFAILCLTAWLSHTQERVNHRDVALLSGVQVAQVSLMVKALRAKKLVTQHPGVEDTRVRFVTLTNAGIDLLARALPMMAEIQAELWPPKSELPDLLETIHKTLARWGTHDS